MAKPRLPSTPVPADPPPFGAPPLIAGEAEDDYAAFAARVADAVAPADVLEEMWVRDVVDLAWEVSRLRRLKASLIRVTAWEGVEMLLRRLLPYKEAGVLARRWSLGDGDAIAEVDGLLGAAGLNLDAVMAQTLALQLDDVERFDRLIMLAEARRAAVLYEIDRHRAALAQALRRVAHDADATPLATPGGRMTALATRPRKATARIAAHNAG